MLYALGLGESVVAVTHECDYPPDAAHLPQITRSMIEPGLSAAGIDAAVRERTERGEALYELDEDKLAELAPNLVITQALCAVCAVSFDDVRAIAARLPSPPAVMALDPCSLGEVLVDARRVATACGVPERGGASPPPPSAGSCRCAPPCATFRLRECSRSSGSTRHSWVVTGCPR